MKKYANLIENMRRILELAEKPDKEEYLTILKLTLLGFTITGAVAFGAWIAISVLLQQLIGLTPSS